MYLHKFTIYLSKFPTVQRLLPCVLVFFLHIHTTKQFFFSCIKLNAKLTLKTMNKQTVCDLISVVSKSTDKNVIYKALYKLRADLVKDKEGIVLFYDCDGVPPLVRLISKPYEKILEIALSILGNCCTHKECCKQV